jgi:hypothetical protein
MQKMKSALCILLAVFLLAMGFVAEGGYKNV